MKKKQSDTKYQVDYGIIYNKRYLTEDIQVNMVKGSEMLQLQITIITVTVNARCYLHSCQVELISKYVLGVFPLFLSLLCFLLHNIFLMFFFSLESLIGRFD